MAWLLSILGAVLAALAAAAALLLVIGRRQARIHALETPADEIHHASTGDGWRIALHRYRPREVAAGREPVLLCHGLLSNRFSLDLDEEVSLARSLREAGFDTWLMELRAHGGSVGESGRGWGGSPHRFGYDWTLDPYVDEDLPAAVRHVLKVSGAATLHFVGHSLGGMLLYAWCARKDPAPFRSAVTIDSPGHLAPLRHFSWPIRLIARAIPLVPVLLFKPIFHLLVRLAPPEMVRRDLSLAPEKVTSIVYNALIDYGSARALLHLARALAAGRFQSFDGRVNYEEGPSRIRFPLLVLRAPRAQSPESSVRHAYERAASGSKRYVRCSREEGFSLDHNHFSLVLGESAPGEIFPLIAGWLREHSSA